MPAPCRPVDRVIRAGTSSIRPSVRRSKFLRLDGRGEAAVGAARASASRLATTDRREARSFYSDYSPRTAAVSVAIKRRKAPVVIDELYAARAAKNSRPLSVTKTASNPVAVEEKK